MRLQPSSNKRTMISKRLISIISVSFALLSYLSCAKPEEKQENFVASLSVSPASLSFDNEGGTAEISVLSNLDWSISADSWISVTPLTGTASATATKITVSIPENLTSDPIAGYITVSNGKNTGKVSVTQRGAVIDGIETITISEFREKKDNASFWYRISGEVISIAGPDMGDLFIADKTAYVYVYGLSPKGGTNIEFPSLGIKPGDKITIVAHKTTYNGIIETNGAYLDSYTKGEYTTGKKTSTAPDWMELPALEHGGINYFLQHFMVDGSRNYSVNFDPQNRLAKWVAYPLCNGNIGSGKRSDAYAYDPLVPISEQATLYKKSYQIGNGAQFVRGHMVPSADRLNFRANVDVFLATNIMPQNSDLNAGVWEVLEKRIRNNWVKNSDTLYVVVGTDISRSETYVLDTDGKQITVPNSIYKAILSYSAKDGYRGVGFYFENSSVSAGLELEKSAISIDELEKKTGVDFFVNLPDDLETQVESKNPQSDSFWWR